MLPPPLLPESCSSLTKAAVNATSLLRPPVFFPLQRTLTGPAILSQDGWVGIPSEMFSPPAASLDWPRYVIISLTTAVSASDKKIKV